MVEKIFLLILCGIMCINQILADESSDHLIRRKRVINLEEDGDIPVQNGTAPFVVNIRHSLENRNLGVGAILSMYTVITTAECVNTHDISIIKVLVGSTTYFKGEQHNVITKKLHYGNHHRSNSDGIALLTVSPTIFHSRTAPIQLHQGPLLPGMAATIFGWGCNPTAPRGTDYYRRLRGITVPIMNHTDCKNIYQSRLVISDNNICTYDVNKRCGHTDSGAPLVVDNQLAGLHLMKGKTQGRIDPDIFVLLQSLDYGPWIRNNIIHNLAQMRGSN